MNPIDNAYILPGMKMSDIISGNPFLLLMLEHMEIGLRVQEKTIQQVCSESRTDLDLFLVIANLYSGHKPANETRYSSDAILTCLKYLSNSHRYYLEDMYPRIKQHIVEINRLNDSPEIQMLGKFFNKYFQEVTEHLDYENDVVFPYVLELDKTLSGKSENDPKSSYQVNEYREHHDDIEEKLEDLNNLLIKYMPEKNDRKTRRKLLLSLFELEYDLRIHSEVEERILIPLVEQMEHLVKDRNV